MNTVASIYIRTVGKEIDHSDGHEQWVPVELMRGVAGPRKPTTVVCSPHSHHHNTHQTNHFRHKEKCVKPSQIFRCIHFCCAPCCNIVIASNYLIQLLIWSTWPVLK